MTEANGPSVGPSAPSVQRLVIDRSRWLRGEGGSPSRLLRPADGKMCCLGFFACALGAQPFQIRDAGDPGDDDCEGIVDIWPEWIFTGGRSTSTSESCNRLVEANDSRDVDEAQREQQIAAIFAEHGVEVVFTDGEASAASARNAPPETSGALSTEGKEKP